MTAIVAIAVNPAEGENPYFLIASDSLRVLRQEDDQGHLRTVFVGNDFKKIFEVNKRVIGIAGKMDDGFIEILIDQLKERDLNFEDFCSFAFGIVKNYVKNQSSFDFTRCNIVIGESNGIKSSIAHFLISKENADEGKLQILSPEKGNAIPVNIGNTKGMDDIFEKFKTRVKNAVNLNSFVVKKAAREYVESVADRLPEYCDKNVVIKKI